MLVSSALIVTAVGVSPVSAAPAKGKFTPGLIAVDAPLTGSQSSTGIDMYRGAELAANQINAAGGVDGVQLKLVKADDKATASTGVTVAKKVIGQHVFGVVGPFNSSVGVANLPVYKSAGISIVRLTSAAPTQGFGATTQPMDVQVAPVEAKEITQVLHATRVAVIYDTSTYTSGIAKSLGRLLTADGHAPVTVQSIKEGQTNFSKAVSAAAAAKPDLLYIAAYGKEAGLIALQASQKNVGGTCFVDLAAQGPDFVSNATVPVAQKCLNSGVPSAQEFAGATQYVANYQSAYQAAPGTWGTFTYDSVEILAQAVKDAGGWNQAAVQSKLVHTSAYPGITGTITIQPKTGNRANTPVVMLDIDAGGNYTVDPAWAQAADFPLTSTVPATTQAAS
ncbi:MAG: branched-chain amino acid transport system substrate-binding protein [Acidimicrobiaceae bacterium]|nr:branched-chain amino acid transport system substrate-binding protein [Acidimicrobiaceae bacterium]